MPHSRAADHRGSSYIRPKPTTALGVRRRINRTAPPFRRKHQAGSRKERRERLRTVSLVNHSIMSWRQSAIAQRAGIGDEPTRNRA